MPWLVSMRMTGQLNGARPMVRTRRSVICRADGLELVLVFCGRASRVSSAQKPADSAAAVVLRKLRRGFKGLTSIQNKLQARRPALRGHCQRGLKHGARVADVECV